MNKLYKWEERQRLKSELRLEQRKVRRLETKLSALAIVAVVWSITGYLVGVTLGAALL